MTPPTNSVARPDALLHPRSAESRIFGSGDMAARTREFDWLSTPLGAIDTWSDALVISVNTMLANQHPMFLFWGNELTQLYNEAAIPALGLQKHPGALGQPARDCWAEAWHIVGPKLLQAYAGDAVWAEDQYTPISRNGQMQDCWFTYSYSPVRDGEGVIRGVLVTFLETTAHILGARALHSERARLASLFEQAPAFFAVLDGPHHVYQMANPNYMRLVGNREILGKPVHEAIPEAVEQGYLAILDRVYQTGEPFIGNDASILLHGANGEQEEHFVDFVYQPLRDSDGGISGIFVVGVDVTERHNALLAMVEAQKSTTEVLESVTDGFHRIDREGRFTLLNAAARAAYADHGVDPAEVLGRRVFEVFPAFEQEEGGRALARTLHERVPTSAESLYGPWNRWFAVRHFPTPDGGVASFFQDVSERHQTEALLAEQRERFEFATHAAQIGYWFCDLPFDELVWDRQVKEHFWLPPDANVNISLFYRRLHPDDRERTRLAIEFSIANHTRYEVEYRTVSADGQIKWIRALGRTDYDAAGRAIRFDGVTLDITALRLAREALDAEQRRLAVVFANVPIGLVFIAADGHLVSGNRQAERILGRPLHEGAPGANYFDWDTFYPDRTRVEPENRPLTRALQEGGIHRGEYIYAHPDGSEVWVEFTGAPIRDASGATLGAVAAIADIDGRKRAEQALVRSEKLALVGRLATTISHEINNPLEAVVNLLYLIHENTLDDQTRHFSRMAQDELARVSHIVTHTLRFNRQANGEAEESVGELLDMSIGIYEVRLRHSGIQVERAYLANRRIVCFGSELRQVFANLIGNAFDATKDGGRLFLRTRDSRHARTGEPGVRVTIADDGQGMSAATRVRLFEPFFTTKGNQGTGLGLWVSREILTKHRAEVRVKSTQSPECSGTVFSIWLPLNAVRPAAS